MAEAVPSVSGKRLPARASGVPLLPQALMISASSPSKRATPAPSMSKSTPASSATRAKISAGSRSCATAAATRARAACSRASSCRRSSACLRAVMSLNVATKATGSPSSSRSTDELTMTGKRVPSRRLKMRSASLWPCSRSRHVCARMTSSSSSGQYGNGAGAPTSSS